MKRVAEVVVRNLNATQQRIIEMTQHGKSLKK